MPILDIHSKFFDDITDGIVEMFTEDETLDENLPEPIHIYKGPQLLGVETFAEFVFRGRVTSYEYTMGGEQVDIEAEWMVVCVTRHFGEPDVLESYVSIHAANVVRCIIANRRKPLLWNVAVPGPSVVVVVRDEEDQGFEVETIPVRISFEHGIS